MLILRLVALMSSFGRAVILVALVGLGAGCADTMAQSSTTRADRYQRTDNPRDAPGGASGPSSAPRDMPGAGRGSATPRGK